VVGVQLSRRNGKACINAVATLVSTDGVPGARSEATSGRFLVMWVGGMGEGKERSDELKGASKASAEKGLLE